MTNRIMPPPERESFEREIKNLLSDGDIKSIARYTQKDRSVVSKAFNPDVPERNNWVYLFVVLLWACDCLREGLADEILKIVHRERDKWTARTTRIYTNPADTTTHIGTEFCEFFNTELKALPLDVQIKELTDVRQAVETKMAELVERRRRQYFGEQK